MNFATLLASSFADSSFVKLFADMSPWCIGLFVIGIIFCIIEVFIPGFGFFGITGTILIAIGMILRLLTGGDAWMLVYMLIIFSALLLVLFLVISRAINKGKLGKTSIFNVGTAVPEGQTEGTKNFTHLLGQIGTTQTVLRPVGKGMFDGQVVDIVARDGFIAQDVQVKVVDVEGQRVVVIEIEEDK